MEKEIEMFEIKDKNDAVVGTEIFDPNLPSNIDFDEKEEEQHEKSFINPDKKIPEMGQALNIGTDLKAYRLTGKLTSNPKSQHPTGAIINHLSNSHSAKVLDHKGSGLKKIWESLMGYCRR